MLYSMTVYRNIVISPATSKTSHMPCFSGVVGGYGVNFYQVFSLPGRSPGRAIVLPPASALALEAAALAKC